MGIKWQECFVQTVCDYCENTTLHGFQYLVEPKRSKLEKFLWFLVLVVSIVVAVYLFYLMSIEFAKTPTVITLESTSFSIDKVKFPGVAICDVNRISKKAAMIIAKERYKRLNLTLEDLFSQIQYLGALYDYNIHNIAQVQQLYRILEAKNDKLSKYYNEIIKVMLKLTPPCSETLVKCFWNGNEVKCNQIFKIRRTMIGFCCVFNSFTTEEQKFETEDFKINAKQINTSVLTVSGYEMGLTVLVKSDVDDYHYPLIPMEGVRIFIFRPYDYADMYSGGVFENLIPLQTEVFLQVEASTTYAVEELEQYKIQDRGCVLDSDIDFKDGDLFDIDHYSYSNCISECKMKSILALCDCVPFFMPVSSTFKPSKQVCTLADITCLDKYSDKWMTIYPRSDDEDLEFERDNSVICNCFPACTYTEYDVANDYSSLVNTGTGLLKGLDPRKHSLVHIYFDTEQTVLFKTDLYYYWFDQISNFGGLCGLFLGFSIISIIEFIYFFTVHYVHLLSKTRTNISKVSVRSSVTNISIIDQFKLNEHEIRDISN